MMSKKAIKVICIVLAALMILSCVAVLLQTFAADVNFVKPSMGDNDLDYILPVVIIAVALVAIISAFVVPMIKKKNK